MSQNPYVRLGWLFGFLIVANIINYYYWNWGLISVNVKDAPLSKVISSIEWQSWVKIYTNLPETTKVTMYVDHVPLSEAMETLVANIGGGGAGPPPDRPPGNAGRPPAGTADQNPGNPGQPGIGARDGANGFAGGPGAPPNGQPGLGGPNGQAGPGGQSRRGNQGGGGRGGFGGVQWNLAFFVGPNKAAVREEIRSFQSGSEDDDSKIFNYQTNLDFLTTSDSTAAPDPRLQAWSGLKPGAQPPSTNRNPGPNGDATAADTPPAPVPNWPATLQDNLQAFALTSNVWIMAPTGWNPTVGAPPLPNSSLISAVKNFISGQRGTVTQAIVLRSGRGGRGGRGEDGWEYSMDRTRNAINGLAEEDRGDAMAALNAEIQFHQDLLKAPPDQQRKMMFQHRMEQMVNGGRIGRMSPTKRALMFQRLVAAKQAAQGKK